MTSYPDFTLISHTLCPFVQRAAIAMLEKKVPFTRKDIDLQNKPDWFLKLSPTGKVPVLQVGEDTVLFESSVIAEYLDEITEGKLHPADPLKKAHNRAWMEFASGILMSTYGFYTASDEQTLQAKLQEVKDKLARLEENLGDGPFFNGADFALVDTAYAPIARYFSIFAESGYDVTQGLPKLQAYAKALLARESVQKAVSEQYPQLFKEYITKRGGILGERIKQAA